jgi:two-component system cell cycle sensor histidine kinase/response regulator CckA
VPAKKAFSLRRLPLVAALHPRRIHGRLLLFLGVFAIWIAPLAAQEHVPERPRVGDPLPNRGELVVGTASDSFPYSYTENDGPPKGYTVDLLNAVARVMQLPLRRVVAPSRDIQDRFRAGEFDLLQALSQTMERDTYAQFSVPFLVLQGAIFVRKDSGIRRLSDFNGRKFAIGGTGSIVEQFFREQGIKVQPVYGSSTIEGLRALESGEVSGVFASQLTALSVMQRDNIKGIQMLSQNFPNYDIRHCYAVHPGDAQLLARLNEGLAILHRTGEFDEIYNRWFGRFDGPVITRERLVTYSAGALGIAFILALWGFLHQRTLRRRIAGQAAELAGQQAHLQALYDNIPMAICVFEVGPEGGRVLSINRAAEGWFGVAPAAAAGRMLATLPVNTEWLAQLTELLPRGLVGEEQVRAERRLDGQRKRVIFTLVPMNAGPAGHPRLCVLVEDITERRNLDEEVAQSRKLRAVGELVGGIAHEFNNLLTPIMLKVGEIQLYWSHDPRLLAETRLISEAVQRSAELTRRLLTFGRKADSRLEEIFLGKLIDNTFSLLKLTVDRRIHWEQDVPGDLPPIYFSPTNLNQIILNLVINARDTLLDKLAAHPGEWTPFIRVEVRLLPAGAVSHAAAEPSLRQIIGWQRLTVRDNGLGMTPEVRERIFEPFFTTKDVGKGTGLGLATVWHLVSEVSGRIEVESVPGQGTAFHVFLPMLPAPAGPAAAPAAPAAATIQKARIFLAEDDELVANAVSLALDHAGHKVTRMADGAEAWRHLQDHLADYHLLAFDVNMPGLDGIELAQRVRTTLRYRGPILIMSGRLGTDDLKQLAEIRVDRVLNKPFAVQELTDTVRQCLAARPMA